MRTNLWSLTCLSVVASACLDEPRSPDTLGPDELVAPVFSAHGEHGSNDRTHLSGREEVPSRDTRAHG